MTTEYSIDVDDWQNEKWNQLGRSIIEESCTHKTEESGDETSMRYAGYCEECEFHEDSGYPMMNYAYPLPFCPDNEKILEILKRTNLTVVENQDTEEYFLALTGGGMDLSQDIALAYLIAQNRIPHPLAQGVNKQPCLSVGKKDFLFIAREIKKQLKFNIQYDKENIKEWSRAIKEAKEMK